MGPTGQHDLLSHELSRPLYEVSARCADQRLPALSGPWVLGCGADGLLDRALSLETGRLIRFPRSLQSPGWGEGYVYEPGISGGLYRLEEEGLVEIPGALRLMERLVAPVAVDGAHLAALDATHVQAFPQEQAARTLYAARPAGWYPPALAWPFVAWVEDVGQGDEDVLQIDLSARGARRTLAGGPGHQRHVLGSRGYLAWVEETELVVYDTRDGSERRIPARSGFSAPPSLWTDVICYETRDQSDIDVLCSDGLNATGPADQRWPSRWSRWLVIREGDTVFLRTAAPKQ